MATKKTKVEKRVQGQIADATGHTDFNGGLTDAVKRIIEVVRDSRKWTYVNGNPFFFQSNFDKADENRLTVALDDADEPTFAITGELQGGARKSARPTTKVEGIISKQPLSAMLRGKKRAQLAVSLSNDHGVEKLTVYVSDYNGSRAKLSNRLEDTVASIVNALRPESELKAAARKSQG